MFNELCFIEAYEQTALVLSDNVDRESGDGHQMTKIDFEMN